MKRPGRGWISVGEWAWIAVAPLWACSHVIDLERDDFALSGSAEDADVALDVEDREDHETGEIRALDRGIPDTGDAQRPAPDDATWDGGATTPSDAVICTPSEEMCDGVDNDCNGQIDEGFPDLGEPCRIGRGPCAVEGKLVCAPSGRRLICDGPGDERGLCVRCDGEADQAPCNGCPSGVEVPMGWACIPAGSDWLGSPADEAARAADETRHNVAFTRPFFIATTEVTQGEWTALAGRNPSHFAEDANGGCVGDPCETRPVENITWYEVAAFANALSAQADLPRCYQNPADQSDYDFDDANHSTRPQWTGLDCLGFRLPTEAEWEYAARASTDDATYAPLDEVAWQGDNADGRTHPVALKRPNRWGLYDVLGNVLEWVWDLYGDYPPEGAEVADPTGPEPVGPAGRGDRVQRGGFWVGGVVQNSAIRVAMRWHGEANGRASFLGVRLARTVDPNRAEARSPPDGDRPQE